MGRTEGKRLIQRKVGGKDWRQSPEVQRDRSRRGTEKLNTERNLGIGTRWGCKKRGWWGELSGLSTGVLRDPVVYPKSVREWRRAGLLDGRAGGRSVEPQDRWWSWRMGGGVE